MKKYDCVVVGGGMVGASSALTLAQLGLSVALVEKSAPNAFQHEQPFDLRVSAISLSSEHLLQSLDAWNAISNSRSCPYQRLGVWEQQRAYTEFNSEDIHQAHLGHIVENRVIQLALWQQIERHNNITLYCPESVSQFEQINHEVIVTLANEQLHTKLLIAADGANSQIRQQAGIGITGWDYQQSAMLINVETHASQQNITWQQFRPTGPVAMFSLSGNFSSLVW